MTSPITVEQIERRAVGELIAFPSNARTHSRRQISQIAASIRQFGFVNPILVGTDNVIIAGHGRLAAAKQLGMQDVPVIVVGHLTETQRRALVLADNQLALQAGWDEEMLRQELAALQDEDFSLELIGFDDAELTRFLADDCLAGTKDEDAIPPLAPGFITRLGEIWCLGHHKLLCGDATLTSNVDALMMGETADLVFTDLPCYVDYEGYTEEHRRTQRDPKGVRDFPQFLAAAFGNYRRIVKPSASLYVCHCFCCQREFQNELEAAGFAVHCQVIWAKQKLTPGTGRYKLQHEPIFYGHLAGEKNPWYGNKSQSTLWEENQPAASREYPNAKPVWLVERALAHSTQPEDLVIDLFAGAGSTLIACERLGRKARVMEIDPWYADVMIRRWQEYTGQAAVLEGDGGSFDEIGRRRGCQMSRD